MILIRILMVLLIVSFSVSAQQCLEARILEGGIRRHASKKVMPIFPEDARKEKSAGVAVAQIRLDERGTLTSVEVLQAPHSSIGRNTVEAIKQWVFEVHWGKDEKPICFVGKLTFYFVIENGKGYVRDPEKFRNDSQ